MVTSALVIVAFVAGVALSTKIKSMLGLLEADAKADEAKVVADVKAKV